MKMLKFLNKKKDNKGFSLVELIIVVAIMAILVGLLAPQYIKYVEKSRKSADASNLSEMVNAVQIYAADAESSLPKGTYTITINKTATNNVGTTITSTDASSTAVDQVKAAVAETAPDYASTTLKSSKWGDNADDVPISAAITVNDEGGTQVTYSPAKLQTFVKNKTGAAGSSN